MDKTPMQRSVSARRATIAPGPSPEHTPRAPYVRQTSDDATRPVRRPPLVHPSSSEQIFQRRNAYTEIPMVISMPPQMQRRETQNTARSAPTPRSPVTPGDYLSMSSRSTHALLSPMGTRMAPPLRRRSSVTHVPQFFNQPTAYRPGLLLAMSNLGVTLFGLGEVVLQRTIWPASEYAGLDPDGTVIPSGTPGTGNFTGTHKGDIAVGTVFMAVGVAVAFRASYMFLQDAQYLARRQNRENPSLRRPRAYWAAHQLGLSLLVGQRFLSELARPYVPPKQTWLVSLPAALGTAIFAVTQAQSFSSSELYNGPMPLVYRGAISQVARAGVSSWIVLGAMAGTPNISSYLREAVKLYATASTAVAYSLSLTTARLLQRDMPTQPVIGPARPRGDFTAMQAFGLYSVARFISAVSAAILELSAFPAVRAYPPPPPPPGAPQQDVASFFRGLPPPLKTAAANDTLVAEAAFLMSISLGLASYAFLQFRKDALPRGQRYANTMFGLAIGCVFLGQVFRVLNENAKDHADFQRLWVAMPFGVLANAIAFVVIPELFSQSEITQGNKVVPYRYQVMEACRATGTALFAMWVSTSQILFVPPLVRQILVTSASLLCLLGMALADSTTRARQTGALLPELEAYELH